MKHMTLRDSALEGVPLRVLRASFSGELSYEVNVPSAQAPWLLSLLWAHHAACGGTLYGIEALQILRIEKGYLHIGTDTDGTTLPADVGFGARPGAQVSAVRRPSLAAAAGRARPAAPAARRTRAGRRPHAAAGGRPARQRAAAHADARGTSPPAA